MPESPKACWSCGAARSPAEALCPSCGKVQPPPPPEGVLDRFAVMGLPRSYDLDERTLEETFRSLSRKLHPDRFARRPPRERRFSLEQTTLLNDAYRTLRDPVKRAEHLLALRGVKVAGEERGSAALPQEFLEQALEDREKLLEAKMEGGPEAVAKLAEGVRGKRREAMEEVARALREERPTQAQLEQAGQLLARLRYYARYLDEVEGRAAEI